MEERYNLERYLTRSTDPRRSSIRLSELLSVEPWRSSSSTSSISEHDDLDDDDEVIDDYTGLDIDVDEDDNFPLDDRSTVGLDTRDRYSATSDESEDLAQIFNLDEISQRINLGVDDPPPDSSVEPTLSWRNGSWIWNPANRLRESSRGNVHARASAAPLEQYSLRRTSTRGISGHRMVHSRLSWHHDRLNTNFTSPSARRSLRTWTADRLRDCAYTIDKRATHFACRSGLLLQSMTYLAQLRESDSCTESLAKAFRCGVVSSHLMYEPFSDLILNLNSLARPVFSSWFTTGSIFTGYQHASHCSRERITWSGSRYREHEISSRDYLRPRRNAAIQGIDLLDNSLDIRSNPNCTACKLRFPRDRWPVKVTIYDVDYENLSVSAVMEAYNIPDNADITDYPENNNETWKSLSCKASSITTYMEGEIIDLRKSTLITESFKSNVNLDTMYWSKLEPMRSASVETSYDDNHTGILNPGESANGTRTRFTKASQRSSKRSKEWWNDEENVKQNDNSQLNGSNDNVNYDTLGQKLLSREWLNQIMQTHLLMRWKEKCFVTQRDGTNSTAITCDVGHGQNLVNSEDSNDCTGLTISGFYYVTMRREDGNIQGLYCDPATNPHQYLSLTPVDGGIRSAWEFT